MATRKTVQLERGDLADLARVLGRSPGHLSRVIAGTREPSPELAADIALHTGVPLASLRLPGRGWRKGRKRTAANRAAISEGQRKRHARNREK